MVFGTLGSWEHEECGSDITVKLSQSSGSPSRNTIKLIFYSNGNFMLAYLMIALWNASISRQIKAKLHLIKAISRLRLIRNAEIMLIERLLAAL